MRHILYAAVLLVSMQHTGTVESRPFYGSPLIGANRNVIDNTSDFDSYKILANTKDAFDCALLYELTGEEQYASESAKLLRKANASVLRTSRFLKMENGELIRLLDASILVRGSDNWSAKDSSSFSMAVEYNLAALSPENKNDKEKKALLQLYLEKNDDARLTLSTQEYNYGEVSVPMAVAAEKMGLNLWKSVSREKNTSAYESALNDILYPKLEGTVLSDRRFFTSVLNLDSKGLEEVRLATESGDWNKARKEFVRYLKTRDIPVWHFNWRDAASEFSRVPGYDTSVADARSSNYLEAVHIPYQFGDTVDWMCNPTPNKYKEWTWHLSYHDWWNTLRQAYWATGNEKYAQAFVKQMRSWISQSPRPDFHARVEYSRWRSIETGIRMYDAWPNAFFGFLASPSFDDDSIVEMVKSFYEHGLHLRAYYRTHNWLAKEMYGLFTIGTIFPEFRESEEWKDFASEKMRIEIGTQFYSEDGMQTELSPGYHIGTQRNIYGLYKLGSKNAYPFGKDQIAGLENTYDAVFKIMMPDRRTPAHNDSGWSDAAKVLSEGLDIFTEREDWRYAITSGKEGRTPEFDSVWMPWCGWYVMRSGWNADDMYAFFDVGPFGAGHQHEDKLSMILSAYGNLLLTEGGTYAYDTSEWRKYIQSARAHNVSRVDGKDQSRRSVVAKPDIKVNDEKQKNRRIFRDGYEFGEGWYSDGFGVDNEVKVTQYRALLWVKDRYWLVFDYFTPEDDIEHRYETWFHLNTNSFTVPEGLNGVCGNEPGKANLSVLCFRPSSVADVVLAQEEPEVQGWKSEQGASVYECVPSVTPVFRSKGSGNQIHPYILYPTEPEQELPLSEIRMTEGKLEVLYKDGTKDIVGYSFGENSLSTLSVNGQEILTEKDSPEWDDVSEAIWPDGFTVEEIPSSVDGNIQKAYMRQSSKKNAPLVVVLHTWSGGYDQKDRLVDAVLQKDWNYIHPDFRGPNNTPQSTVSDLALSDIEDAIRYAVLNTGCNPENVHIIGASGGGLAALASYMSLQYPVKSVSAWAPISDIGAWYDESLGRGRNYSKDILKVFGKGEKMDYIEAAKRSPIYKNLPSGERRKVPLFIYEGIHDGYTGSVPVTHSLRMYNRIVGELKYGISDLQKIQSISAEDKDLISYEEMLGLVTKRMNPDAPDETILERKIHYRKDYGNIHLILFEGGHEELSGALDLLEINK